MKYCLALAFSILFSAACSDDAGRSALVGAWQWPDGTTYTFMDDGTWEFSVETSGYGTVILMGRWTLDGDELTMATPDNEFMFRVERLSEREMDMETLPSGPSVRARKLLES